MQNFIEELDLTSDFQKLNEQIAIAQANSQRPEVAVLAGHYCLSPELTDLSSEGEAEIFSFCLGVALYKSLKTSNKPARLILWVNDIGIDTQQREEIKSNYQIPDNYLRVLEEQTIPLSELEVVFESASRNKASTLLRKKIKHNPERFQKYDSQDPALIRCIDIDFCEIQTGKTVYAINGPEGAPLVMKEGSNPKCNLILATLFLRIAQDNPDLLFVNIFNDIYIERIRLGMFVARQVYELPHKFINLFCDDESFYIENFETMKNSNSELDEKEPAYAS
ncbi:hypothetical protein [Aliikangiella maris]|uniref:Uncharacterized protein n=2 Tax=Aliikangiella maris TaxID=3162458 RepID=A0ABV3MS25_9GAMM